jgi:micrococcal nuclease
MHCDLFSRTTILRHLLYAVFLSFFCASIVFAAKKETSYGDLPDVQFIKNYDGDTITVDLKGQHPLFGDDISVRVAGIDTPEIRGKCVREKNLAREAKELAGQLLEDARIIHLQNVRRGKYFRIVADIQADGVDIAEELMNQGLAVQYDGGTKTYDWCRGKSKKGTRVEKKDDEEGWLQCLINIIKICLSWL